MIKLKIFPASCGDCFLLEIKDGEKNINILVDGGFAKTYNDYLGPYLKKLGKKGEKLDLVINTHIDSDHINGLISFVKDNNTNKFITIDDFWFNGLEQIVINYPKLNVEQNDLDTQLIDTINKKGYESEFQQKEEISSKEGISLSGLLEYGGYNHNKVNDHRAITDSLEKIKISENISIKVIAPHLDDLLMLEDKWFTELESKNFHFTIPKNEKLVTSFEFLISRLKTYYDSFKSKISSSEDINLYLSNLEAEDNSVVNGSSIAFVLEIYDKKLLFLGDAIIKKSDKCKIIQNLIKEYKNNLNFELIKLPHHGSNYNITKDFINLVNCKEYIISTNSSKHNHPDLDVLANLIIKEDEKFFVFNYDINQASLINNDLWKTKYKYNVITGNGTKIIERSY